jgi:CRP-like cAMP-binding protein
MTLGEGQILFRYGEMIHHAYFPVTAVASLVSLLEEGKCIEIGMVGFESVVGLPAILGPNVAIHTAEVLVPGRMLRIRIDVLKEHLGRNDPLCRQLTLHMWSLLAQFSRLAVCNLCHQIPERLSRWLLSLQDRATTNEFRLSHEQIAEKLSIRRSGVTIQLGSFERMGAIESGRRRIRIVDREILKMHSCECYRRMSEEAGLSHGPRLISDLGNAAPTLLPHPQPIHLGT